MTATSLCKGRTESSWHVCLYLIGAYTVFWLFPAITDWVGRALPGTYESFQDLSQYEFGDMVAMAILKHHMWLLVAMVSLNVLATVTCFLAVRRLSIGVPLSLYTGGFLAIGVSILFSDIRLYHMGINTGEDAFVMTLMWFILGVPLWLFGARGIWSKVSGQLANNQMQNICA